jgi:alanine racemase
VRPSKISIDTNALLHNLNRAKDLAPSSKVVAMVKANAYGNGLELCVKTLSGKVHLFGVACIEEALAIRACGCDDEVLLLEGFFYSDELALIQQHNFTITVNNQQQLRALLASKLTKKLKVWLKIDTGMHRLGFEPSQVQAIYEQLKNCPWVDDEIVMMTHFSSADEMESSKTLGQISSFEQITVGLKAPLSLANSAAVIAWPNTHRDYIRPGIMLYGASPIANQSAESLGLYAVMHFHSEVIALCHLKPGEAVGYGELWRAKRPSKIATIAVGYGDGYPRVLKENTPVYINGCYAPVVGMVSMDMLSIDVTEVPDVDIGSKVELWGSNVSIDVIAKHANTIAYELMCKVTSRAR